MKFNTLTFDANLPTVQQVNVPTNSDYKVGMKVKRNGAVQSIKPSEFTVYTGEINVIPPTEWGGTSLTAETQSSSLGFIADKDDACEALVGQTIKAKDFYLEASYDNGATWHKLTAQNYSIAQLTLNDRATGKNASIARLDFNEGNLVWYIKDSDPQWSETVEEIQMPERMGVAMNTVASNWNITSYPCLVRIGCSWGGYEERVTYPVDQDKTNGYVTITKASGDEASFKQYGVTVDADKTYAVNEYVGTQQGPNNGPLVVMDIDLSPLAGTTFTPDQLFLAVKQGKSTDTEPASRAELEALLKPYMQSTMPNTHWALGGGSRLVNPSGKQIMFYDQIIMQTNFNYFGWKEGDAPIFLVNNVGEATLYTQTSFTIENGAHLIFRCNALAANRYAAALFKLLPQEAIHADFKLNINEFKSQSGDIAETLADGTSVKVDGTYADGTEFSFDFCTK